MLSGAEKWYNYIKYRESLLAFARTQLTRRMHNFIRCGCRAQRDEKRNNLYINLIFNIKIRLLILSLNFSDKPVAKAANLFHSLWWFDSIPCHALPLQFFASIIIEHTTLSRATLDEWSARRRLLYLATQIHAAGGIRTRNPIKQVAACPRLRPRGHRDRRGYQRNNTKQKKRRTECPQLDSNPRSQPSKGCRPAPQTAQAGELASSISCQLSALHLNQF